MSLGRHCLCEVFLRWGTNDQKVKKMNHMGAGEKSGHKHIHTDIVRKNGIGYVFRQLFVYAITCIFYLLSSYLISCMKDCFDIKAVFLYPAQQVASRVSGLVLRLGNCLYGASRILLVGFLQVFQFPHTWSRVYFSAQYSWHRFITTLTMIKQPLKMNSC